MNKRFVTANELLEDAFRLAVNIIDSGFEPELLIGLWRGGTPVAVAVHETLSVAGMDTVHIPLKTAFYTGIDQRGSSVQLSGLEQLGQFQFRRVLVVDDVFDTGHTMHTVVTALSQHPCCREANLRCATPWWKPAQNKTPIAPDYWLHKTADWIVFPHEMVGLDQAELEAKPGAAAVVNMLRRRGQA